MCAGNGLRSGRENRWQALRLQHPQVTADFPFVDYYPKCHSSVLPETTFLDDFGRTIERIEGPNMIKKRSSTSAAGARVHNWIINGEEK